jgi:hypothetical protein
MGAAFDDALITAVATVISTEARAFNNANRYILRHTIHVSANVLTELVWISGHPTSTRSATRDGDVGKKRLAKILTIYLHTYML